MTASTPVGVTLMGHGDTASRMLAAARRIVPTGLDAVVAVDAGEGETPALTGQVCSALERSDEGRGVVLLVDLPFSSPCECAKRQAGGRELVVVSGVNLAMVLKVASLDLAKLSPREVAEACADTARRSVHVAGAEETAR